MKEKLIPELEEKYTQLKQMFCRWEQAAVAFSGGVDSALLLYAAKDAIGERALAITAVSPLFPGHETQDAKDFCARYEISQQTLRMDPFSVDGFAGNPPDRCYLCKKKLFQSILDLAQSEGIGIVCDGSNVDDEGDYRPGLKALGELKVHSPLRECGLKKEEIRVLSAHFGLPTWDKPSCACLASRIPYGEEITEKKLQMVEEGEALLRSLGFRQMRVRVHGTLARIETEPGDFARLAQEELRDQIYAGFAAIGFSYVSADLRGYRTGSMNEVLKKV